MVNVYPLLFVLAVMYTFVVLGSDLLFLGISNLNSNWYGLLQLKVVYFWPCTGKASFSDLSINTICSPGTSIMPLKFMVIS